MWTFEKEKWHRAQRIGPKQRGNQLAQLCCDHRVVRTELVDVPEDGGLVCKTCAALPL